MDYASIVDYFPETEVLIFEESDLSGAGLPGLQAGRPREPWCSLIYLVLIRIIASDVLATPVLSIDVPSTRDGANVRVPDTTPVNDDGKR